MQLNEMSFKDAVPVDGYGPGFFRVADQVFEGPLLLTATGVLPWGGLDDDAALVALKDQIDVLFVGTGAEITHIPADLRRKLEEVGLGVESMSSPSACRTFNVLLSEGRRVAVAALPV
ncbi:Mth938-like domain-containing protein [uncultured Pelagimonas sp.]|uniref:Mth938-like domain-containing protein n=1 Tax=uncultured Pelagimonas sp. TaxID=1618102 RepID=UPI00260A7671|nr:Mth938-like domain-containing protein [uncultured Pelagimonas sp.]